MRCNIYNLEELATIKYGKNQKKILSKTGTVPIYGTGGLIGHGTQYLYNKPSILIGRKGSIEKIRYVDHPFWTVDTLFYTEINTNLVIPLYLYYKIFLMDLSKYNEGTTIPSLRTETLNKMQFEIPNIEDQLKIVSVIRPIDLKIKNNQQINHNLWLYIILYVCDKDVGTILFIYVFIDYEQINHNLEEQAENIFTDYFINISHVPNHWKESGLLQIAHYTNGLPMQKYRPKKHEQGIPVLKIKELRQGYCDNDSDLCTSKLNKEYIIDKGDVIFSWSGSLLVDFWCGDRCGLNQHLFKITSTRFEKWFYYSWTKYHLNHFIKIASDKATTMGHIKRDDLEQAKVLIPSEQEYLKLSMQLSPIYDLIIANRIQSHTLTALRDTLLPKLMSGEIDVSAVEIGR